MAEAMNIEELRRGVAALDLERTLGDPEAVDEINDALAAGDFEEAKATITAMLRGLQAVSLGGFPVGAEVDLVDLVGFDD
jgi:hypothetical protein